MNRTHVRVAGWLPISAFLAATACAQFDIQINYSGSTDPAYVAAFEWAEEQWERRITGYAPGVNLTSLEIDARLIDIPDLDDGIGTVDRLGQASPNFGSLVTQQGYTLPTSGYMEFDTDDLPFLVEIEALNYVVLHEMAHVIGFGVLWSRNGLVSGNRYIGENAVAAYQNEWVPDAPWVPLETEGGSGTARLHWDEVFQGADWTNITLLSDPSRDFAYEIMTGWLNYRAYEPIISNTTVQSFADLGYTVVPEPAGVVLGATGLVILIATGRRRLVSRRRAA